MVYITDNAVKTKHLKHLSQVCRMVVVQLWFVFLKKNNISLLQLERNYCTFFWDNTAHN